MNIKRLFKLMIQGHQIKDTFTISTMGGLIATIFVNISNALLWKANKTEILFGHLSASMLMHPLRTKQKKNFFLGQVLNLITGSLLGIPMFLILKLTGTDNLFLKGFLGGGFIWGSLYSFGIKAGFYTAKPHLTKTHYSYLYHNTVYGLISAFTMKWLADPSVFPNKQQNQRLEPKDVPLQDEIDTRQGSYSPVVSGTSESPQMEWPYY